MEKGKSHCTAASKSGLWRGGGQMPGALLRMLNYPQANERTLNQTRVVTL